MIRELPAGRCVSRGLPQWGPDREKICRNAPTHTADFPTFINDLVINFQIAQAPATAVLVEDWIARVEPSGTYRLHKFAKNMALHRLGTWPMMIRDYAAVVTIAVNKRFGGTSLLSLTPTSFLFCSRIVSQETR